jgi:hypothetical protein
MSSIQVGVFYLTIFNISYQQNSYSEDGLWSTFQSTFGLPTLNLLCQT